MGMFSKKAKTPELIAGPSEAKGYTGQFGSARWTPEGYQYTAQPADAQRTYERERSRELTAESYRQLMQPDAQRYQQFQQAMQGQLQGRADEQFQKQQRGINESLSARGMMGSRAYADIQSQAMKNKMRGDIDISQRSTLAAQDLAARDYQQKLGAYQYAQQYGNQLGQQDWQRQYAGEQLGMAGAGQGSQADLRRWLSYAPYQERNAQAKAAASGKQGWFPMATTAAGAAIGGYFGGPAGAKMGASIGKAGGSAIDQYQAQ